MPNLTLILLGVTPVGLFPSCVVSVWWIFTSPEFNPTLVLI